MMSCATGAGSGREDKKVVVISNGNYVEWFTNTRNGEWQPTPEDMAAVDAVLKKAVKDGKFDFIKRASLKKVKERYRQYLCYYNSEGHKMVFINSFCEERDDWRTEMWDVADGGSCYWRMEIDLTTMTYNYVTVNGEA